MPRLGASVWGFVFRILSGLVHFIFHRGGFLGFPGTEPIRTRSTVSRLSDQKGAFSCQLAAGAWATSCALAEQDSGCVRVSYWVPTVDGRHPFRTTLCKTSSIHSVAELPLTSTWHPPAVDDGLADQLEAGEWTRKLASAQGRRAASEEGPNKNTCQSA